MAKVTVSRLEGQIEDVEGFRVRVTRDGGEVRGDKKELSSYPFQRAGFKRSTVRDWTESRFHRYYPEFDVEVLLGNGQVAKPRRHLDGVRDTY